MAAGDVPCCVTSRYVHIAAVIVVVVVLVVLSFKPYQAHFIYRLPILQSTSQNFAFCLHVGYLPDLRESSRVFYFFVFFIIIPV